MIKSTATNAITLFIYINFFFSCFIDIVSSQSPYPTKPIISFCAGLYHSCAVFDNKRMKCWGLKPSWGLVNAVDYLGDTLSELGDFMPYVDVGTGIGIDQIACGRNHVCMKLDTGDMKCLGKNQYGTAGLGVFNPTIGASTGYIGDALPASILGTGVNLANISAGAFHNCILTVEGKVKCFGNNLFGQLGLGNKLNKGGSSSDMGDNLPYINFGTGIEVISLHSGPIALHNCVTLSKPSAVAQRIKCWGRNDYYQLGYGDIINRGDNAGEMGDNLPLVDLGTESRVKQVILGFLHTCALLVNDALKCFGDGEYGQLGSGFPNNIIASGDSTPSVLIDPGKKVKFITAGNFHTCIVYDDQLTMKCFGYNNVGQLGQGDIMNRGNAPDTKIPNITNIDLGTGLLKISLIESGYNFNCVIFSEGSVKCFGGNVPGLLAIESNATAIGAGPGEMGNNLLYSMLFSLTTSPTISPSRSPASTTRSPTKLPTWMPTQPCEYYSPKICKYDVKCTWKKVNGKKQCVIFNCAGLSRGKCGKQRKKCKWNKINHCEAI